MRGNGFRMEPLQIDMTVAETVAAVVFKAPLRPDTSRTDHTFLRPSLSKALYYT
jgi:hypothetical protein